MLFPPCAGGYATPFAKSTAEGACLGVTKGQSDFSHIRAGTPPPKHGLIFQHRRVHNAPKERRGKVARALAAKLAIAARLDYFRGEEVPEFLSEAQARIDRLVGGDGP